MAFADRKKIIDLIELNSNATIALELPDKNIKWTEIQNIKKLTNNNFFVIIKDVIQSNECVEHDIPFIYGYAVSNYFDFMTLAKKGASQIKIAPPLTHQLTKMRALADKMNIKLRMYTNLAIVSDLNLLSDNVCGNWIRPEDISIYKKYIDIFEFEECDSAKEETLYSIYAIKQAWPGDLEMLITGLNHPGVNRMVDPALSRRRIDCGQRCQQDGNCNLCYKMLDLANPALFREKYDQQ